jgi:hypothetical protein
MADQQQAGRKSMPPEVETLELNRETLQDLSEQEAEDAQGGYQVVTGAVCRQEGCRWDTSVCIPK